MTTNKTNNQPEPQLITLDNGEQFDVIVTFDDCTIIDIKIFDGEGYVDTDYFGEDISEMIWEEVDSLI